MSALFIPICAALLKELEGGECASGCRERTCKTKIVKFTSRKLSLYEMCSLVADRCYLINLIRKIEKCSWTLLSSYHTFHCKSMKFLFHSFFCATCTADSVLLLTNLVRNRPVEFLYSQNWSNNLTNRESCHRSVIEIRVAWIYLPLFIAD